MANNYTLGRGEIHFGKFTPGTVIPQGELYLGNTPEVNFTIETENLDHFSSDRGIREKDESVALETTRAGSLTCDNIDPANLAYFFFGEDDTFSVVAGTVDDELIEDVRLGATYQLGTSPSVPQGQINLTFYTADTVGNRVVVTDPTAVTTYLEDVDYTIDLALGRITFLEGGTLIDGDDVEVDYKTTTQSIVRVVSGSTPIEGSMRFIAKNPKGRQFDYFMPWVKLTPNGDFALKGEEWQTIPFNLEILKKTGLEAFYIYERTVGIT